MKDIHYIQEKYPTFHTLECFLESDIVEIHSIMYTILSIPVNSC